MDIYIIKNIQPKCIPTRVISHPAPIRPQMPDKGLQAMGRHLLLCDWLTKQQQSHLLSTVQCMVNTLSSRATGRTGPSGQQH